MCAPMAYGDVCCAGTAPRPTSLPLFAATATWQLAILTRRNRAHSPQQRARGWSTHSRLPPRREKRSMGQGRTTGCAKVSFGLKPSHTGQGGRDLAACVACVDPSVPMSFNAFACALCRAPPTASTTSLCEAALYVDCCKGIERQQVSRPRGTSLSGDGPLPSTAHHVGSFTHTVRCAPTAPHCDCVPG